MKMTFRFLLILALVVPAAAESAAPELPFIDAAVVRSRPFEKENINIGAAFPGMQTCGFTAVHGRTCVFTCKDGSTVNRPAIQSSLVPDGCAKFIMVPAGAPKASAAPAAGWDVYETGNFPNGSVIWSLSECARDYRDTPYLGCYASPELAINRKENGKPAVKVKGMIVSKIMPNENSHDSGGYGYCLKDKHLYRIVHEVRVMEKGRAAAYLYPEFYGSGFKPGTAQNLYEWGGAMWGTASCDKTDKALVFTGENVYTVTSPGPALDFGNIVFTLDVKQLTFTKL